MSQIAKISLIVSGYIFLSLSVILLVVGIWMLGLLIINKFDMGIHGVPHAMSLGGFLYGAIALLLSRLSFKFSKKFVRENHV